MSTSYEYGRGTQSGKSLLGCVVHRKRFLESHQLPEKVTCGVSFQELPTPVPTSDLLALRAVPLFKLPLR